MKAKDALPKARQQGPPKPARSKRSSSDQDWSKAHHVAGIVAGLYLAYLYTGQLKLLHENQLWFSHLTVSGNIHVYTGSTNVNRMDLCCAGVGAGPIFPK